MSKLLAASDPDVRSTGIGGSDAGAVLGVNPYRTPLDLYLEKRGLVEPDPPSGQAAHWGKVLEPIVIRHYAEETGRWVLCRNQHGVAMLISPHPADTVEFLDEYEARSLGTLRHPQYEHMMCHIDGLAYDEYPRSTVDADVRPVAIIESKTVGLRMSRGWGEGADQIPHTALVQCNHNALVYEGATGERLPVHVPVLIGGQEYRLYTIRPDSELQQHLIDAEASFWAGVMDGDPPPAEWTDRGIKALRKLHPSDTGEEKIVEPGSILDAAVVVLLDNRKAEKMLADKVSAAQVPVMEAMGDVSRLIGEGYKVLWTQSKDRVTTDWAKCFEALTGLLGVDEGTITSITEEHTTTRPGSRSFRVYDNRQEGDEDED